LPESADSLATNWPRSQGRRFRRLGRQGKVAHHPAWNAL